MIYKVILNFIGLHLKTEINEALVTNSKHHRSPYISTNFMRFPWLVIGRKNWLFSTNPNGAEASAMLYSIVETAKANGLILYDYMVKCMQELSKAEPDIDALLPWNFKH